MTHYVYRYYNAGGELLYIGCTNSPARRERQHVSASPWFSLATRRTIKSYPDRDQALHAERLAVIKEVPLHNVIRFATTWRGAYLRPSPAVQELLDGQSA